MSECPHCGHTATLAEILADIPRQIATEIREVLPTAVKVTWGTREWDNGYFLQDDPTVTFADGSTEPWTECLPDDEPDLMPEWSTDLTEYVGRVGCSEQFEMDLLTGAFG